MPCSQVSPVASLRRVSIDSERTCAYSPPRRDLLFQPYARLAHQLCEATIPQLIAIGECARHATARRLQHPSPMTSARFGGSSRCQYTTCGTLAFELAGSPQTRHVLPNPRATVEALIASYCVTDVVCSYPSRASARGVPPTSALERACFPPPSVKPPKLSQPAWNRAPSKLCRQEACRRDSASSQALRCSAAAAGRREKSRPRGIRPRRGGPSSSARRTRHCRPGAEAAQEAPWWRGILGQAAD